MEEVLCRMTNGIFFVDVAVIWTSLSKNELLWIYLWLSSKIKQAQGKCFIVWWASSNIVYENWMTA